MGEFLWICVMDLTMMCQFWSGVEIVSLVFVFKGFSEMPLEPWHFLLDHEGQKGKRKGMLTTHTHTRLKVFHATHVDSRISYLPHHSFLLSRNPHAHGFPKTPVRFLATT